MSPQTSSMAERLEGGLSAFDWPGQAEWLPGLRRRGFEHFRRHGLPTRSVERWKYTRLDELEQHPAEWVAAPAEAVTGLPRPLLEHGLRVRLVDGQCLAVEGDLPEGVELKSLEQALSGDAPALRDMLDGLEIEQAASAMAALNTASLRHGLYLSIAAGVDAGEVLLQWAASGAADALFANARVCLVLGEGARVRLVEQFESAEGHAGQFNGVTQIRLAGDSHLEHVRLQQESDRSVLVTMTEAEQAAGSEYHYTGLDFGGGKVRHDVRARLLGSGAKCSLNGACLTRGRSHVDNHLDAEHLAPDCASRQYFRAVLGDRSRVVFNGRVHVAPGADGTDAQQSSGGLLLSPLAEIDSKPELEIYADEVIASHGATVGQIDPEQEFYLRSRGVDRDTARTLLTMAFCRSVIEHLEAGRLRDLLEARLQACLGEAGVGDV